MLKSNPFSEFAIAEYSQFQKLPFLESDSIKEISNAIKNQIRDDFRFSERLLILGMRGIGKTSCLFHVRDLLESSEKGLNIITVSKLIANNEELEREAGADMKTISNSKTFVLIDFPDNPKKLQFEQFLDFVWNTMISSRYSSINFVICLNINHYDASLTISEVLGKFHRVRLDSLTREETERLIKLRLTMVEAGDIFNKEVYDLIYRYSKGIPRNIICACRSLADNFLDKDTISYPEAAKILREDFTEQIINDRVEDVNERLLYKKVMEIIATRFNGYIECQENLLDVIKQDMGIGRNKSMKSIDKLTEFGLVNVTKGGKNNTQKVISLI